MDDVFQILIYILILVSFLSSIFKKKKKRPADQNKQHSLQHQQNESQHIIDEEETKIKYSEDADLMKEFEKFFQIEQPQKNEPEIVEQTFVEPKKQKRPGYVERNRIDDKGWHEPTESEHRYTNVWEKKSAETKQKISKVDSAIEKQAARFEQQLRAKSGSGSASQISKSIRKRLQNPSSLKEYVIISEIMGNPKALQ